MKVQNNLHTELFASSNAFGWLQIIRVGLIQTCLGAIVVLTTSTLNRIMVVELMLPAMLPGALVGWHYAIQLSRPRMGHGSDSGKRRTPWILGGMLALAIGGVLAAFSTYIASETLVAGIVVSVIAFSLIGAGVGAAGTSLLALLAKRVDDSKRAQAATLVWVMMIFGFVLTAGVAGHFLDPFSFARLITISAVVSILALVVSCLALAGLEGSADSPDPTSSDAPKKNFKEALALVWSDTASRWFTVFVFVSMLAYSAQDLVIEPYAGTVFNFTPGESTQLSGMQHGGVLVGMLLVALFGLTTVGKNPATLRLFTIFGCWASAAMLGLLAVAADLGPVVSLKTIVFWLGVANGTFAVGAIGTMMHLANAPGDQREGIRMGLWGAAQAIAFAVGGFLGTVSLDISKLFISSISSSYALVFAIQSIVFMLAAILAIRLNTMLREPHQQNIQQVNTS